MKQAIAGLVLALSLVGCGTQVAQTGAPVSAPHSLQAQAKKKSGPIMYVAMGFRGKITKVKKDGDFHDLQVTLRAVSGSAYKGTFTAGLRLNGSGPKFSNVDPKDIKVGAVIEADVHTATMNATGDTILKGLGLSNVKPVKK